MKILIFTEGTILMHKNAVGHTREEIVKQSKGTLLVFRDKSVSDYKSYIPIGNAVKKLKTWKNNGVEILYLTSRKKPEEVEQIQNVLKEFNFPDGSLLFCQKNERYKDVAERIAPDALIEDDCESIGGEKELTITNIKPEIKNKIKSIVVPEFGGIDHLPDRILPKIIDEVGFDFSWSSKKVWALDYPTEDMEISVLEWHFTIPFWDKPKGYYNLSPNEVINNPEKFKKEYERTMKVDMSHPIDIMMNKGRWLILDGLHRLVRAKIQGEDKVKVRKIPRLEISKIRS